MSSELVLAAAVAAAAGLMRGFAGVGSGMMMAPIFAIVFGPVQTVAVIILMEMAATAQMLPGVRRDIDWRVIAPMGAAAAAFMPAGSWLLVSLDADTVARAMAFVVLAFSLVLLAGWRYEGTKPLAATLGVGALSGTMMAATSLGNPPVMIYLLSSRDAAAANRANFTAYFAVTLVALAAMMTAYGLIDGEALRRAALLLPGFLTGIWVGSRMFSRASERTYRRVALTILAAIGVFGVLR